MNPDTVTYAEAEGNFPALTKDRDGIPKNSQSACIRAESQRRSTPDETNLIERLVKRENMLEAYHRVVSNKGVAGVDGVTVKQLKGFINKHMNIAFPKKLFDSMGLVSMLNKICIYQKLYFGTAVYGTVRTVV